MTMKRKKRKNNMKLPGILELFNMKLSKTIDQTRICKKNYNDPLGYFCMGLFFLLVPTDKWQTNFTCSTDASTIGQLQAN
jgi:hypothetical protein